MDAYLAAGELRNATNFYLNINFELLNGCNLKCPGCHVEKNAQNPLEGADYLNFYKLLNGLQKSLYVPFIAFVGPTDFLSSENFAAVFENPEIISILHNFKRLSLQTTYLDFRNVEMAAKILRDHYQDMEIEINIVVDPAKILDDRYLSIIQNNKMKFLDLIGRKDVRSFGIMNVYDYDTTKIPELLKDYDFMHNRVSHLFETTIDYNFSFGRNRNIGNEEFIRLTNRIKKLFDTSLVSDDKNEYLRFSFGKLTDSLIERQYNYRSGKLYYSPLLYERFVSFRDEFVVPLVNYTVSEIEDFEMQMQLEQYSKAPEMDECVECPFVASCIDRGILHLMNTFGTTSCLVAKEALCSVNSISNSSCSP